MYENLVVVPDSVSGIIPYLRVRQAQLHIILGGI